MLDVINDSDENFYFWKYNYFLYQVSDPSAYSPFLLSQTYKQDMMDDYIWLAEYQESKGNIEEARKVRDWILTNTSNMESLGN